MKIKFTSRVGGGGRVGGDYMGQTSVLLEQEACLATQARLQARWSWIDRGYARSIYKYITRR